MARAPRILAVGEVLWDIFSDARRFGGAPANFACQAAGCGADVWLVTRIGDDSLGQDALQRLAAQNVRTDEIQIDPTHATGTVIVELDAAGVARYRFADDTAWDHLQWTPSLEQRVADVDVICFGTLGQRSAPSRSTIRRLLTTAPAQILRLLDVNLREPFYDAIRIDESLSWANALKLNDDELPIVSNAVGISGSEEQRIETLRERYHLEWVAVTRGERGSTIHTAQAWSHRSGHAVEVFDTVGAGDAFAAGLALGHFHRLDLETTHAWAARLATFACTHAGAISDLPVDLRTPPASN